ncbi:hypothetical protein Fmac_005760 [Flemingia macrophylla]|uniref:At1g61320/AtMIF1 LRR domain-containing protein n=1 Tax=Flemingia macrophylla TaxID=520843 RepID=A0ABD1N8N6_9FABA
MRNQQPNKRRVEGEDYISKLPYNILCSIISFLKVKDGVRTSVLSSKWVNVYANPTNLTLDADNMLKRDHSASNVWFLNEDQKLEIKRERASAFVRNVNKYLSRVGGVRKIVKLKVGFPFGRDGLGSNDLDEWIRFAIVRNVEEIHICLLEESHHNSPNDASSLYVFPCDIVDNEGALRSFLKCLRLAHCVLANMYHNSNGFRTLTTMELFKVDLISEVNIQVLLSRCTNIEWLEFSECYNMVKLSIKNTFCQKLKYLNVNLCHQLKALVIHSTSLETLEYKGGKIEFAFDAPRLKTFFSPVSDSIACHKELWPVLRLPIDLPHLENLIMECGCNMGEVMTIRFPTFTFPSLRHLEVIKVNTTQQDFWWVASILESCPLLERLELHLRTYLCIHQEQRKRGWPPTCQHNHLKEVVMTGIRGYKSEIEIAVYLLRNAIALEKMTIDPRPKCYLGKGKWDHSHGNGTRIHDLRQTVHDLLKKEANSAVELLIKTFNKAQKAHELKKRSPLRTPSRFQRIPFNISRLSRAKL